VMQTLAVAFDGLLNPDKSLRKRGFVLMLFPFGDKSGRCDMVTNGAAREDIVRMFREQIARLEEKYDGE
jgi:hypothetical protein